MRDIEFMVERLLVLEDLRTASRGEEHQPSVCRVCYYVRQPDDAEDGCLCKNTSWTPLAVVVIELNRSIREAHEQARAKSAHSTPTEAA